MNRAYLSRFTPSAMEPEILEKIFVQRGELARRLEELIRDSANSATKHQTLLVGPRGIGKTFLLSLLYSRMRKDDELRKRLAIARLNEEEWTITSFLDLLQSILRALQLDSPGSDIEFEALYDFPPEQAEERAIEMLESAVGEKTLLVMMENLDDIFKGMQEIEQKRLRSYLQEKSYWTILATTQGLFNGVSSRQKPFYGFFRIEHLQELEFSDVLDLLTRIVDYQRDFELARFLRTPKGKARVRAVHHLAGGNHRIYVIFSQFLTRESLEDLVSLVLQTLDELTPYYQERMRWLSPQQAKIVANLCEARGAISVSEIAKRCFLSSQTTSSQLRTLKEKGYVRSHSVGRQSLYEIKEPLMRLALESKKSRGRPLSLFIQFLRIWYSEKELNERLALLPEDALVEKMYLLSALKSTELCGEDPKIAACAEDLQKYHSKRLFGDALEVTRELIALRGSFGDWHLQASYLALLGRFEEAESAFERALALNFEFEPAQVGYLTLLMMMENRAEEVLIALDQMEESSSINKDGLLNGARIGQIRVGSLMILGRFDEALDHCSAFLASNPNDQWHHEKKFGLLCLLGRLEEALAFLEEHPTQNDKPSALFIRAMLMLSNGRAEESLALLGGLGLPDPRSQPPKQFYEQALGVLGTQSLWDFVRENSYQHDAVSLQTIRLMQSQEMLPMFGEELLRETLRMLEGQREELARWLEYWKKVSDDITELDVPIRLMEAAVRYSESRDASILLELPVEERDLLLPLLEQIRP